MSAALVVLRKEVVDHFRDRRSLLSALLMPVLGPAIFAATFALMARNFSADKPLELAVVNAATVKAAPADYEEQLRDGKLDAVLLVPADYAKDFAGGRPATLRLVLDGSRARGQVAVQRTRRLVQAYGAELGALRLLARGVSPELAAPVALDELDLATPQKFAAQVLAMIPLFLLVAAFMGGMHLAIDSTAGERERGSLEALLINPVTTRQVVLGKWLATVLVTWLAVAVTLLGFLVVLRFAPLGALGVRAHIGPAEVAGMLLVVLPVTLFAAALQMLVSTFARTFKEGQTYASLLALVPMAPGLALMTTQGKPALWTSVLPIVGQTMLMNELLRGEAPALVWFALAALAVFACAALCLGFTMRLLSSERVVFGR